MTGVLELLKGDGTDQTTDATRELLYPHADGTWWYKGSDGIEHALSGVTSSRQIIAGAGTTGGGDLSADRTIDVVADPDGTLVVAADSMKVGTLIAGNVPSGLITSAMIADGTVKPADMENTTQSTVLARAAGAGTGPPSWLGVTAMKSLLVYAFADLSGQIVSSQITDGTVANADLANSPALTVKGNTTTAAAVPADLSVQQLAQVYTHGTATRSIIANSATLNGTSEIVLVSLPLGSTNTLAAGDVFRIFAAGTATNAITAGNVTFRVRFGASGVSGTLIYATTAAAGSTTAAIHELSVTAYLTIRSVGASGTVIGDLRYAGLAVAAQAAVVAPTAITVDTTQATPSLTVTFQQSAANATAGGMTTGFIEKVA